MYNTSSRRLVVNEVPTGSVRFVPRPPDFIESVKISQNSDVPDHCKEDLKAFVKAFNAKAAGGPTLELATAKRFLFNKYVNRPEELKKELRSKSSALLLHYNRTGKDDVDSYKVAMIVVFEEYRPDTGDPASWSQRRNSAGSPKVKRTNERLYQQQLKAHLPRPKDAVYSCVQCYFVECNGHLVVVKGADTLAFPLH